MLWVYLQRGAAHAAVGAAAGVDDHQRPGPDVRRHLEQLGPARSRPMKVKRLTEADVSHGLHAAIPVDNPCCSCKEVSRGVLDEGDSWLAAAIPMDNPCCSCKLTDPRVESWLTSCNSCG